MKHLRPLVRVVPARARRRKLAEAAWGTKGHGNRPVLRGEVR